VKISTKIVYLTIAFLLAAQVYAANEGVSVVGSVPAEVIINVPKSPTKYTSQNALPTASTTEPTQTEVKHILLQRVVLSPSAQQFLDKKVRTAETETPDDLAQTDGTALPIKKTLGMNNVPVFDQGMHGACVTFAATAILDAALNKGNYISQLCNLELTETLYPATSMGPHGWEGSTDHIIMDQIKKYGIITNQYQDTYGCAGVFKYPAYERSNWGNPMPASEFVKHSEPVMSTLTATSIMNNNNAFSVRTDPEVAFAKVKEALAKGHRVLIAYLVDQQVHRVGALGRYRVMNDSWIMSADIKKHILRHEIEAGHAVVLTGYDDTKEIKNDKDHSTHKGIFIIRNSWGKFAGNRGEYYMSYDYFKMMADEAIEIK
jgi:hypothetical protein